MYLYICFVIKYNSKNSVSYFKICTLRHALASIYVFFALLGILLTIFELTTTTFYNLHLKNLTLLFDSLTINHIWEKYCNLPHLKSFHTLGLVLGFIFSCRIASKTSILHTFFMYSKFYCNFWMSNFKSLISFKFYKWSWFWYFQQLFRGWIRHNVF